jgi:pimeloyl-ACP methyl ester carboxylesterase
MVGRVKRDEPRPEHGRRSGITVPCLRRQDPSPPSAPHAGPLGDVAGVRAAVGQLARDVPHLLTPSGMHGAALEAAWWTLHLTTYPWGLLREDHEPSDRYHLQGLAPAQRGLLEHSVEAASTPIVLVHGVIDNRAIFTLLKRRLRRKGFGTVVTVNYSPITNDIRRAARALATEIEAIVALTGYERVHVIGHSLGGLIARYYVQRYGGDERVHTLVTLGTPHTGSLHAHLLPVRICRQLRPGSELMAELALPAPGCRTRFVAYWSDLDQVILPHVSARLEHPDLSVRNVAVHDYGHLSIPRVGKVAHEIAGLLGQLDHEGHTLTAGVTTLREDSPA